MRNISIGPLEWPAMEGAMQYRADVDGLRAVAVLSVLFFHVGAPFATGGYVGVDIFFVISGYVITGRILNDIDKGIFSVADFYQRRIRRIFPALFATICACIPLFYMLMLPDDLTELFNSVVAAVFSVSNIYFWKTSGYFDPAANMRPLLHTWSLSVEEQFYLFVPIFILLISKNSRRFAIVSLLLVASASLLLSVVLAARAPSANFYLLPTRAWELLMGALIAVLGKKIVLDRTLSLALQWSGLILVIGTIIFYTPDTSFPGLTAIPPILGATLLIACGASGGLVTSALSSWPMVSLGKLSYSLYLVHWPIIVAARYWLLGEPDAFWAFVICILSICAAILSWKYVENPIRYSSSPWLSGKLLFAGAAGTVVALGLGGYIGAFALRSMVASTSSEAHAAANGRSIGWESSCFLENRRFNEWKGADCLRTTGATQTALLWGDSFAAHYVSGISQLADKAQVNILQYTSAGCPPILGYNSLAIRYCMDFNTNVFDVIAKHNVKIVIMSARWDLLRGRGLEGLRPTIEKLREKGLEVYVIGGSPLFTFNPQYIAMRRASEDHSRDLSWLFSNEQFARNALIKSLVGSDATFIDPMRTLCPERRCIYFQDGQPLFADYGHFTAQGAKIAVESYFPLIDGKSVNAEHSEGLKR